MHSADQEGDQGKRIYVRKRQPEITPENKSNETSRVTAERDFERMSEQGQLVAKSKGLAN